MKIGMMRLYKEEWMERNPLSLDGGDPFRNGTPLACKLIAKPAFKADVLDAIEAADPILISTAVSIPPQERKA